jgi:drug/metabolite transporter (DMT)-like permease
VATYSQLFAALLLLPLVPFVMPHQAPTAAATGSLLALALLCTALAYLLYFYLIFKIGPTRATMVTYLSPVFGTLWGFLLLHESLGAGALAGFGLVLAGVRLVSGRRARERISG